VNDRAEQIWRRLVELPASRAYQAAFETATGLPLRFLPVRGLDELERVSGPFCGLIGSHGVVPVSCPSKLHCVHHEPGAHGGVACVCCVADVTEVVVPVMIGTTHIGNLLMGPFCLHAPTSRDIHALSRLLGREDPDATPRQIAHLQADLRKIPVLTPSRYRAAATLAGMFAQYLSESGNRLLLEAAGAESLLLKKIQRCFESRGTDAVPLAQLSRAVGLSPSRLCKQFKKETGLTLGEYRLRQRIERAKTLLLNQHTRICEAAYDAGFGSIPHFNRAFRRLVGCAPTEYRHQVSVANWAKQLTIHA
jgi:AraC-like DNA-binding protein/ligand-binding sensor protein